MEVSKIQLQTATSFETLQDQTQMQCLKVQIKVKCTSWTFKHKDKRLGIFSIFRCDMFSHEVTIATFSNLQEKTQIIDELALKARRITKGLNRVEGIQCSEVAGSLHAFPRIFLPTRAIQEAEVTAASICLFEHTEVEVTSVQRSD